MGLFKAYIRSIVFGRGAPGVYWTLPVEISFYLLIFIVLALRKFQYIAAVAAIIGLASSTFWLASAIWPETLPPWVTSQTATLLLLRHGCFFAIGIFLWRLSQFGPTVWGILAIAICTVAAGIEISNQTRLLVEATGSRRSYLAAYALWLGATTLIAGSIWFNGLVRSPLQPLAKSARLVGLSTYPLYLVHDIVGAAFMVALVTAGLQKSIALAWTFLAMIAMAAMITIYGEPLVRRAITGQSDNYGAGRR